MAGDTMNGETRRVVLFGDKGHLVEAEFKRFPRLSLVEDAPDIVVCYGGDGTLLTSERLWPSVPKVPISATTVGYHCIHRAPAEVLDSLNRGRLIENRFSKLNCLLRHQCNGGGERAVSPLNEIYVHMARINSAVRYKLWIDGVPYHGGDEIIADGLIACTPFGSSAYFSRITRGIFREGIGIAFPATSDQINHLMLTERSKIEVHITRGPAVLAYDSADEQFPLEAGDRLFVRKHAEDAVILGYPPE